MGPFEAIAQWVATLTLSSVWKVLVDVLTLLLIGVVPWVLARSAVRRERRNVIASIHRDLTTGEVADARHTVGTELKHVAEQEPLEDRLQLIRAYYNLRWAVERADNAVRAAGLKWELDGQPFAGERRQGKDKFSTRALGWNISAILTNLATIDTLHAAELGIDNAQSTVWFEKHMSAPLRTLYSNAKPVVPDDTTPDKKNTLSMEHRPGA